MKNSQKKTVFSFVSFYRFMCVCVCECAGEWVLDEKKVVYDNAIATLLLSSFVRLHIHLASSLHCSVFNFDRHRCHGNDNDGILGTHNEHMPCDRRHRHSHTLIGRYMPFTVCTSVAIHISQCETYDSRRYKIRNRSQIKTNSSEYTYTRGAEGAAAAAKKNMTTHMPRHISAPVMYSQEIVQEAKAFHKKIIIRREKNEMRNVSGVATRFH